MGGFWRRTVKKDRVVVEAVLADRWNAAGRVALEAEAGRYGEFLGLAAALVVTPGSPA